MKKILVAFIILVILSGVTTVVAASDHTEEQYCYIKYSHVSLLKEPELNSEVETLITHVDRYLLLEETEGWTKIQMDDGSVGWLPNDLVTGIPNMYVKIKADASVNIRTSPTTNSESLGLVEPEVTLKYIKTFHSWYKVNYKEQEGYVASWLGKIIAPAGEKIYLIGNHVNIRNTPNIDGEVIGTGSFKDTFSYLGKDKGWVKIASPQGEIGYVAGWLTTFNPLNHHYEEENLEKRKVTASNLRLREGPSTDYDILDLMSDGGIVRILESKDNWAKIISPDGRIGYCSEDYLETFQSLNGKTIVLDPGHGGRDRGAKGYGGTKEKGVNLQVAKELKNILENMGATVYLTRDNDDYIGMYERAEMSEKMDADIFLSLHHNAITNKDYFGTSLYYDTSQNTNGDEGEKLARHIYENVTQSIGIEENGVYDRNYIVLREQNQVAALIEMGFISSDWEEKNINLPSYQQKMAYKIAKGIEEYFYD